MGRRLKTFNSTKKVIFRNYLRFTQSDFQQEKGGSFSEPIIPDWRGIKIIVDFVVGNSDFLA